MVAYRNAVGRRDRDEHAIHVTPYDSAWHRRAAKVVYAQDHRRSAAGPPRECATNQRREHHPDGPRPTAASRRIRRLRTTAPISRKGSFNAAGNGAEKGPVIASLPPAPHHKDRPS